MAGNEAGSLRDEACDAAPVPDGAFVALSGGQPDDGTGCVVARSTFALDEPGCFGVDEGLIVTAAREPGEEHVQPL